MDAGGGPSGTEGSPEERGGERTLFGLPSPDDRRPVRDAVDIAHRANADLHAATELMKEAQRVANFGSWEWRLEDDQVAWSEQLYRIFGLDPVRDASSFQLSVATYLDRVHDDDRSRIQDAIEGALEDKKPFRFEHRVVRPGGDVRTVRCQGEPVLDPPTGRIERVVGVCQDVTELAESERARSEADARFRSAFENAPIGIALIEFSDGADGRLTAVNRSLCELTGRTAGELVGSTFTGLFLSEDAPLDQSLRERLIRGELDRYTAEKRALVGDDRLAWLLLSVSVIPEGIEGRRAGIVQVQDVTQRKRFEEQLRYIADHDSLTGLANRRRFREELDSHLALKRRYGGHGALLLVDVDRLKAVNDTRGHGAGDVVLRRVAEAMRARVRSTDLVARLAGDEFAVLLPSAEAGEGEAVANALIARLAAEEVAGWDVSVSIGVAPFGGSEAASVEEVMAIVDAAMYRAKQRGGGVVEVASADDAPAAHSRTDDGAETAEERRQPGKSRLAAGESPPELTGGGVPSLAARVRHALEHDGMLIYGQPVVDLRTGRIAHHEVLVRMADSETGKIMAAADFLGAATQVQGLCSAIDGWVVERTLEMLTNGSRGARFQVNLSGESFGDDRSLEALAGKIRDSGVEPGALAFEIGELSIRRSPERALEVLDLLARVDCPVALDGFSAGFGSFEFLQKLPVKQIKIDGAVVRRLVADDPDNATIGAIVRVAQGTSKATVAKLVDTGDVLPLLRMHGVDMAQGFELGEPVPLAA